MTDGLRHSQLFQAGHIHCLTFAAQQHFEASRAIINALFDRHLSREVRGGSAAFVCSFGTPLGLRIRRY